MRLSSRHLFLLTGLLAACSSNPPATGALRVEVEFNSSLASRCVKVTATDGVVTRETDAMVLAGKTSPLIIAIYPQGMLSSVDVQALGFADDGCTTRTSPLEQSDVVEGQFEEPFGTVKLALARERPDAGIDGGLDAGTGDAGIDAGVDGGTDGGLDSDGDGWNDDVDCQPNNPAIHPDAGETCSDGFDNDCNQLADCMESPKCDNTACPSGTCMSGGCVQPTETMCNDGFDNDGDNRADCLDDDCTGLACNDGSACTSGDTCASDGGCAASITESCNETRVCFATPGLCNPDGGLCSYTPLTLPAGSCDDNNACTVQDACTNGVCGGQPKTCPAPPACFGAGVCQATLDGGCTYAPLAASSGCSDGNNCTTNDRCDGDGGCFGDLQTCTPPTNCHASSGTCDQNGACIWTAVSGGSCDAGMGAPGTCGANFVCNPVQAALFPFTPSNFTEAQLPDGGVVTTFTANTTINTDTLAVSGGQTLPPSTVVNGTLLFRADALTVNNGVTVTFEGSRPVIFAVTGNATINGIVIARSGANPTACDTGGNGGNGSDSGGGAGGAESGSGGGAFGTAGGLGGATSGHSGASGTPNGMPDLIPLRGGCRGGTSAPSNTAGGSGGGAVQFTVGGALTVNGRIGAPGRGGSGAPGGNNGGGGGGSGGAVLLEADVLTLPASARVTANGGGGGEGTRGANGNGGADGHTADATTANGGSGGSNDGGDGGDGAAGNTNAANGSSGSTAGDGAGGGGGGHGRIRFNVKTTCTVNGSAVISPARTLGGSAQCN